MTRARWLRILRHPHRDERVVGWAASPAGAAAVWLAAAALLALRDVRMAAVFCPLLALVFAFPAHRNTILSAGALAVLYGIVLERQGRHLGHLGGDARIVVLAAAVVVFVALYGCVRAAASLDRLPRAVRRRPQTWLHLLLWTALAGAWLLPAESPRLAPNVVRLSVACLPFLVWRCGYLLLAGRRRTAAGTSFADHFFYLAPVHGGTPVPYGKGYDYLADTDAADARARARTRLSGLTLLGLAWAWIGVQGVMDRFVFGDARGSLGLHRLGELVSAYDGPVPLAWAWLTLPAELVSSTLSLAIYGHFVVGALRLCGFAVLRNTYKPLVSESLVDFWNRYYFYFKELLAEFFFFPVYVRWFKRRPRLRLLAATMAAAWLGNVYYHVLLELPALARAGPAGAWSLISPRVFYAFLLAIGIFVSLVRQRSLRAGARAGDALRSGAVRLRRIAGVWLFYSIIHIWNVGPLELTFAQRTRFFLSLFGAGR
jgi:hypothetical protein